MQAPPSDESRRFIGGADVAVSAARLDHVAIQVPDLDGAIDLFTRLLGMTLRRRGTRHATGGRIALLADAKGMKLELIEERTPALALSHLAYRVDDVAGGFEALVRQGCTAVRGPVSLDAAKATFAMVRHASGLDVQLVRYAPDSPDL